MRRRGDAFVTLNRRHPLAYHVLAAWPLLEGGGGQLTDVGVLRRDGTSVRTWAVDGVLGSGISGGISATWPTLGASNLLLPFSPKQGLCFVGWGVNASPDNQRRFLTLGASGGSRCGLTVGQSIYKPGVFYRNGAGTLTYLNGTTSIAAGERRFFAGNVGLGRAEIWLDGTLEASAADENDTNTFAVDSTSAYLGAGTGATTNTWTGEIYGAAIFDRMLTATEIQDLFTDFEGLFALPHRGSLGFVAAIPPPVIPPVNHPTTKTTTSELRRKVLADGGYLALREPLSAGTKEARLQAPAALGATYTLKLPTGLPASAADLRVDTLGQISAQVPVVLESAEFTFNATGKQTCQIAHGLGYTPSAKNISLGFYVTGGSGDPSLYQLGVLSVDSTNVNVYLDCAAWAAQFKLKVVVRIFPE